MTQLREIKSVDVEPGYRLDVTWADGSHSMVDLSGDIFSSGTGIFTSLIDGPTFGSVRVGERARTIEWRVSLEDAETLIDIDADALFAMAEVPVDRDERAVMAGN